MGEKTNSTPENSLSLTELAFLHASDDVSREELTRHLDDEDNFDDGRSQSKVTDF